MTYSTPASILSRNPAPPALAPDADRDAVAAWMLQWIGATAKTLDEERADALTIATAAGYTKRGTAMESVTRSLWALVPWLTGERAGMTMSGLAGVDAWPARWRRAIEVGVDPKHSWSWGTPGDHDQRWVEACILGVAIAWTPEHFWEPLPAKAKDHLAAWLLRINGYKMADNNWRFFRVLANVGLRRVGREHDDAQMRADLHRLDEFYLDGGWYRDGATQQRDYYIPNAMHFYGLLYAMLAGDEDPDRAATYRDRAAQFAHDYARWFASDGGSIVYGRSLTYRFAAATFWPALALAKVEGVDWGLARGIYGRHLAWWSRQPIATENGQLSLGFGYPNLNMTEQYNAPGSPGWAYKAFASLAVPADHPFWSAQAKALPEDEPPHAQPHARMIVQRVAGEARCLCAGQWSGHGMRHAGAKYAKFAYSSALAFSVSLAHDVLSDVAPDSMLALSEDGLGWRVRTATTDHAVGDDWCASTWRPWEDVAIRTWLIAAGAWQVRVHRVQSARALKSAEGGWSIPRYEDPHRATPDAAAGVGGAAIARGGGWVSILTSDDLDRQPQVLATAPNTNLLHPRAVLPMLLGDLEAGETWLACAAWAGESDPGVPEMPWPAVSREGDELVVRVAGAGDRRLHVEG